MGGKNKEKPILTMLKVITKMIIIRIHTKRDKMLKYNGPICLRIQTNMEKAKHKSRLWTSHFVWANLRWYGVIRISDLA